MTGNNPNLGLVNTDRMKDRMRAGGNDRQPRPSIALLLQSRAIIYPECEGRIEKSVPRIAVWHHEACRVMTNGDSEGQIFLSYPHTKNGFFFLLTTVFNNLFIYFKISFQKSLNMLRFNFA